MGVQRDWRGQSNVVARFQLKLVKQETGEPRGIRHSSLLLIRQTAPPALLIDNQRRRDAAPPFRVTLLTSNEKIVNKEMRIKTRDEDKQKLKRLQAS